MACSPEQSRINGSKSKGAKSQRGKEIAARNNIRHGLTSSHPPVLESEGLIQYQEIVQSLQTQYNPIQPIEFLLIQTVAVNWLRLHRIWGYEAAQADLEGVRIPADSDRLSRYERHAQRALNEAVDRLDAIEQRRTETFTGSTSQYVGQRMLDLLKQGNPDMAELPEAQDPSE
jgi:hypothetical protein